MEGWRLITYVSLIILIVLGVSIHRYIKLRKNK